MRQMRQTNILLDSKPRIKTIEAATKEDGLFLYAANFKSKSNFNFNFKRLGYLSRMNKFGPVSDII